MYPNRLKIIFALVIASFTLLVIRLGYLQIFEGAKYSGISQQRLLRDYSVPARRGNIYDRLGRPLAVEEPAFDITVAYKNLLYGHLRSKGELTPPLSRLKAHKNLSARCDSCHNEDGLGLWVSRLSKLLDRTPQQLLSQAEEIINRVEKIKAQVQKRHKRPVRIQEEYASHAIVKDAPLKRAAEVEMHPDLYPGVSLHARPKRHYPYRNVASHILGYVGKPTPEELKNARNTLQPANGDDEKLHHHMSLALSPNDRIGRSGIEAQYNLDLTGSPGKKMEELSLKTLEVNRVIFDMPPRHGNDVFLTIDLDIQRLAEEILGKNNGSIVVLDTRSGDVLAMASHPGFNPNTFAADYGRLLNDPGKPLLNRPIQALLPPGSAFKIVTALTALSEGEIDLDTRFQCSGSITLGGRKFRCHSFHGSVDLLRGIEHSCNVYFYNAARRLSGTAMNEWARAFGFGNKTGIDLPYEASGNVPLPKYAGERLNLSIGQGQLLVTPLQMAQLVSTVANAGVVLSPHLLKKVVTDDGVTLREYKADRPDIIDIPEEDFIAIQRALRQVVISGTAKRKGLDKLRAAGKTGTAQIGNSNKNHLWFVGYAPFDAPRYAFCITIERAAGHSGAVTGPMAGKLVSGLYDIERARRKFVATEKADTHR
ncbi:MAG: penicillin-binding protein 2 [Candidatus Brocadiales bacterium]|nr:penicillin-binding protein 2 [Candidatus Bathyanammoxibius sp.]